MAVMAENQEADADAAEPQLLTELPGATEDARELTGLSAS